jgi:two-component system OmpR family response regulator
VNTDSYAKPVEALIIEDEEDICYLLSGILKKKNLHTSCVNSLFAARKILSEQNPDILFIDNHLPDGFGIDFISVIRQDHPFTKIIMITAHNTSDDKTKALNQGADYFIGKPFSSETIIATVDILLQARTV